MIFAGTLFSENNTTDLHVDLLECRFQIDEDSRKR